MNDASTAAVPENPWLYQWSRFSDDTAFLFKDWIHPNRLEDFKGKTVVDAGCGSGDHLALVAPHARRALGIDLNTPAVARARTREFPGVEVRQGNIAELRLEERFDAVYCVGVLHHTDDPARTFENLCGWVRPGGRLILWVYSYEGNFLNRVVLETIKTRILKRWPRSRLRSLAATLTSLIYPIVYSAYLLPLPFLPYYRYFANWRRLSYERNLLNVFDKLNAPQTHFIRKETLEKWFDPSRFKDVHLSPYKGVSWRASGTRIS